MTSPRIALWRTRRALSEFLLKARLAFVRSYVQRPISERSFSRVCIVTAVDHRNGIARGAQLQLDAFRRIGADVELLDASRAQRNPFFRISHKAASLYVFHCGGPEIAALISAVLPGARNAYRIAYWAWEMPLPPINWPAEVVSEIWTCSQYAKTSIAAGYNLPIAVVPHVVPTAKIPAARYDRVPFTVLVLADTRSSLERKNPIGAAMAFFKAFNNNPDVRLILKINGDSSDLRQSLNAIGLTNLQIIDRFLGDQEMTELFGSASLLLSLHRAEGFGLPLLEAMAAGIPVIGTNWSGNLDFMNPSNSLLVPSKQVPITDVRTYSGFAGTTWAEPDIEAAARMLQELYSNESLYNKLSARGLETAKGMLKSWKIPD